MVEPVTGHCLCGAVSLEIDFPTRWAWHDHSHASRLAHGAAYATCVGSWRRRFRITAGGEVVARYEDETAGQLHADFAVVAAHRPTYERKLFAAYGKHPPRSVLEPGPGASRFTIRHSRNCGTGPNTGWPARPA